jgi:protein phosphatase
MGVDKRINCQVSLSHLEMSGVSDLGLVRTENEDYIYLDQDGRFILLADGMGGHERGAEASETTIGIIKEHLSPKAANQPSPEETDIEGVPSEVVHCYISVKEAIKKANTALFKRNQALNLARFMGTTIVGLVPVRKQFFLWFHIGDSRLYLMRNGRLKCLTTDHSAHKEWENKGRRGREPEKNIITRAVGPKESVVADIKWDHWNQSDLYVLCSDGLTDLITDEEITRMLIENDRAESMANQLVNAAIQAGGKDNISVIICRVLT